MQQHSCSSGGLHVRRGCVGRHLTNRNEMRVFGSYSYALLFLFDSSHVRQSKLKPNTHRRRDETVEFRRVGVGGVYMNSQLTHDDCRRIR